MRAHLVKPCAFGQMPRVLPIGQMRCAFGRANWSNAPYSDTSRIVNVELLMYGIVYLVLLSLQIL